MRDITTLTNQIVRQQSAGQATGRPERPRMLSEDAARHVNDIFRALQAAFPAWRNAFPDNASLQAAKASWVKGLVDAGITDIDRIALGVRRARMSNSDFFPSVGRFIGWCRPAPEDYGLPPEHIAYAEACAYPHAKRVSHPAVFVALSEAGPWEMKTLTERESRPLFGRAYEIVCGRVMAGEDFTDAVPKALPTPEQVPLTEQEIEERRASGQKALSNLKRLFGMKT